MEKGLKLKKFKESKDIVMNYLPSVVASDELI